MVSVAELRNDSRPPQRLRELTAQDENALALLMSDNECTDVIEDAEVLCSVNTNASRKNDKKIIDCRASDTTRIPDMLTQDSNNSVDAPEKVLQIFDTYIPEPLRNADGTPIYVHANESRAVHATHGSSSSGIFAQKSPKQQDLSSMDSLIHDDSSLSSYDAGSKKFMNLSELKRLPISKLVNLAQEMGVENLARMRKQEIIFAYLKARALKNEADPTLRGQVQFFRAIPTDDEAVVDRVLSLCSAVPK